MLARVNDVVVIAAWLLSESFMFARADDMVVIAAWLYGETGWHMISLHMNVLGLVVRGLPILWHSAPGYQHSQVLMPFTASFRHTLPVRFRTGRRGLGSGEDVGVGSGTGSQRLPRLVQ
mgnify:CR=1 FL=1